LSVNQITYEGMGYIAFLKKFYQINTDECCHVNQFMFACAKFSY
jgi:hypothetical protein